MKSHKDLIQEVNNGHEIYTKNEVLNLLNSLNPDQVTLDDFLKDNKAQILKNIKDLFYKEAIENLNIEEHLDLELQGNELSILVNYRTIAECIKDYIEENEDEIIGI